MAKPNIKDMRSIRYLVKYAIDGELTDHELWMVMNKVLEYGKSMASKGWIEEYMEKGPSPQDIEILKQKFLDRKIEGMPTNTEYRAYGRR